MSLYTKEIEDITYQDVTEFCKERHQESIHLDYKEKINSASLAKTLAAMANTWGGIVIVGVEDEDSKPKLPVQGITYKRGLREQINDIVFGNVTPPIFTEVKVCPDEKGDKALIVIKVPQSNTTPHAVKDNTSIYLRTNTGNKPEEKLASIKRISWLAERHQKSTELKESFYQTAERRSAMLCRRAGQDTGQIDTSFSIMPLYPYDILTDYKALPNDILTRMQVSGWGVSEFPLSQKSSCSAFSSVQHGFCHFFQRSFYGLFYNEISQYGFYCHKTKLRKKRDSENKQDIFPLKYLLSRLDLFLTSAIKFYTEIGYWGLLELKVSLDNMEGIPFGDIPKREESYFNNSESFSNGSVDDSINLTKEIVYKELKKNHTELLFDIVKEVGWAGGLESISADDMQYYYDNHKK